MNGLQECVKLHSRMQAKSPIVKLLHVRMAQSVQSAIDTYGMDDMILWYAYYESKVFCWNATVTEGPKRPRREWCPVCTPQ